MPVSDATLVRGVLNGERSAFAELYDRRARLIRAICFDTARDYDTAADLTQEVFLRAYRRLGQLSDADKFSQWLVGIARRVCREFLRREARSSRRLACKAEIEAQHHPGRDDPDVTRSEAVDRLREAVASLPGNERLALHAFYMQELDVEQARATLGLSRSGFYRVLSCARARLRRTLSRAEVVR